MAQDEIYKALKKLRKATVQDLTKMLNANTMTVRISLARLLKKGLINAKYVRVKGKIRAIYYI